MRRSVSIFSSQLSEFPAGLLPIVLFGAKEARIAIEIHDTRTIPVRAMSADIVWLRHYQDNVIWDCLAEGRGIVDAPTGSGKTDCIVALTKLLQCKWLVLVPRIDLLYQTIERFKKITGKEPGIWGDSKYRDDTIVVGMFDTIYKSLQLHDKRAVERLAAFQAVSVDEVHVVAGAKTLLVMQKLPNAYYRFGFSGTPLMRSDERGLLTIGATGPVIAKIDPKDLIEEGFLAKPHIQILSRNIQPIEHVRNWADAEDIVIGDDARLEFVMRHTVLVKRPALVFFRVIEHGKEFLRLLQSHGVKSAFAHGGESGEERKRLIKALMNGSIDVLVASVIFQVGVDLPALQTVVWASGGKAPIPILQALGRGMRVVDGKSSFTFIDIADGVCHECSSLKDPKHTSCVWFSKHVRARMKSYRKLGYDITTE